MDIHPGTPGGILYIEDFDAQPAPAPLPAPSIISPTFTHADLDAARDEGRQAGLAEARTENAELQAQLRSAALANIGDALAATRSEARAAAQHMADELSATVLALLAAALPHAAAHCAENEITALLAAILPPLCRAPELRVRVHPSMVSEIAAALAQHWPDQNARLTLTPDPTLAASDVLVAWPNGEARRNTAALWQDIRTALAPCKLPSLDAILKGTEDGE